MDQPKMERLLRLIVLLTGNRSHSLDSIAHLLDVSVRTLYRYLDTFKANGFIVHQQGDCYYIDKESPFLKEISSKISFSEEEAFILRQAIDGLDDNSVMKYHLRNKLNSIFRSFELDSNIVVNPQESKNVSALHTAIIEKRQVILHQYHSNSSNQTTDRLVEPFQFTENLIQVWCYEVSSVMNKLFKLSRIERVELLDTTYQYESLHQSKNLDIFRMEGDETFVIDITMTMRAANLLREENFRAIDCLTKQDNGLFLLHTTVNSIQGITRFIIGLYDEIIDINPPQLRYHINRRIAAYAIKPKS